MQRKGRNRERESTVHLSPGADSAPVGRVTRHVTGWRPNACHIYLTFIGVLVILSFIFHSNIVRRCWQRRSWMDKCRVIHGQTEAQVIDAALKLKLRVPLLYIPVPCVITFRRIVMKFSWDLQLSETNQPTNFDFKNHWKQYFVNILFRK